MTRYHCEESWSDNPPEIDAGGYITNYAGEMCLRIADDVTLIDGRFHKIKRWQIPGETPFDTNLYPIK